MAYELLLYLVISIVIIFLFLILVGIISFFAITYFDPLWGKISKFALLFIDVSQKFSLLKGTKLFIILATYISFLIYILITYSLTTYIYLIILSAVTYSFGNLLNKEIKFEHGNKYLPLADASSEDTSRLISHVSLFLGVVALIATVVIGIISIYIALNNDQLTKLYGLYKSVVESIYTL
jgi:hypothetical protein